LAKTPLGRRFYTYLGVLLLFTLGNSTDAFLLLRARDLGVATAAVPLLWAALHVVKSLTASPGGKLSDSLGRRPLIIAGWVTYAVVYLGFARASLPWHAWALFLAYGIFFGLTEGVEKALVADLVPASSRGRAFGWYNLAIAAAALPASLFFGFVWERWGAGAAFTLGASLAAVAAAALLILVPLPRSTT
ncbi:MAG: MFS transporter, partial [Gemmatimonadaceae bacterium]